MTSETQFAANRANSQRSTGPTSAAGKARAASNGLTHGLNASPEILFEAKPEEAEAYRTLALKLADGTEKEATLLAATPEGLEVEEVIKVKTKKTTLPPVTLSFVDISEAKVVISFK